jgi:hypothetical protein
MTSKHLVDPQLLQALQTMPSFHLTREDLPALRAGIVEFMARPAPFMDSPPQPDDGVKKVTRSIRGQGVRRTICLPIRLG